MESLYIVLAVLAVGVAFSLQKMWRSGRALSGRCVTELEELTSLLAHRHVIVSHLMDALPESLDHQPNRRSLSEVHELASTALQRISPAAPDASCIRTFSDREQDLVEVVDGLLHQINSDPSLQQLSTISGCVKGLDESTRKIRDAAASYNAAAINFANYMDGLPISIVRRKLSPEGFKLMDLDPNSSGKSGVRVKL